MVQASSLALVLAEGFPKFLTPEIQVLIWSVVVFFTLLALLWRFAWGPIMHALEQREQNIQNKIDTAEKRFREAEAKALEFDEKLNSAKDKVAELITQGKRDADKLREELMAQTNRESAQALERAKSEIELAKRAAVQELRDRVVDLAAEMSARVIEREVKPEDHRRFMQDAIGRLEQEK